MIEDLQKLNPLDDNDFKKIEAEIYDVLLSENMSDADELLEFLNNLLGTKAKEIEQQKPDLYDKYQNYWLKLAYVSFPLLESVDQDTILKTRFLMAVQSGYDPYSIIHTFFNLYDSDDFVKNVFRNFAKDLEQNTEQFGTAPIVVDNKKLMPSLKYWILDYAKTPSRSAKRGSIDRLNYVNQSVNARGLTQVYKQQLLKVLKFYDDLINAERPLAKREPSAPQAPKAAVQSQQAPQINIDKKLDELRVRTKL